MSRTTHGITGRLHANRRAAPALRSAREARVGQGWRGSSAPRASATDVDFVRVCRVDELPAVGAAAANVYGQVLAIVRTREGELYAVDDTCSHANVSLSEGELEGHTLEFVEKRRFCLPSVFSEVCVRYRSRNRQQLFFSLNRIIPPSYI